MPNVRNVFPKCMYLRNVRSLEKIVFGSTLTLSICSTCNILFCYSSYSFEFSISVNVFFITSSLRLYRVKLWCLYSWNFSSNYHYGNLYSYLIFIDRISSSLKIATPDKNLENLCLLIKMPSSIKF